MKLLPVRALVFDVFGTVVDWRGSLIREGRAFGQEKHLDIDWAAFADAWRAGYQPAMHKVRTGKLPWMNIDQLHRLILDDLIQQFGLRGLKEADRDHLNRAWHRLRPWPDSVRGLKRLKRKFIISTLSNGKDASVSVIDTETDKIIATIPVGRRPWNMAITPDGRKLYVANGRSDSVSVIDTETLKPVAEVKVGKLPWGAAIR